MQKFSSFGRKKKNRPKFDIEWICSKTFNCVSIPGKEEISTRFWFVSTCFVRGCSCINELEIF